MVELVDVEEWRRWMQSRPGQADWRRWATHRPSLGGWSVDGLASPRWSPSVDRLQHDLVVLAQRGEGRAAITLLVQLRPALWRLVWGRELEWGESRAEAGDEVRAVFYETVYRHPIDRRPRRIAANLVLDTRQRLRRGAAAGRRPPPLPPGRLAEAEPIGHRSDGSSQPGDELAPVLALRRAVETLPGSPQSRALTASAAYRAWILDQPHSLIAADLGLDRAAVASRLHRLRSAVRRQWEEAA